MKSIFKVVQQGEAQTVPSQKAENGTTTKCSIVLQEFGGKFENTFMATMLGNTALCRFHPNELVVASLQFKTNEYNGKIYQDITVNDIAKLV